MMATIIRKTFDPDLRDIFCIIKRDFDVLMDSINLNIQIDKIQIFYKYLPLFYKWKYPESVHPRYASFNYGLRTWVHGWNDMIYGNFREIFRQELFPIMCGHIRDLNPSIEIYMRDIMEQQSSDSDTDSDDEEEDHHVVGNLEPNDHMVLSQNTQARKVYNIRLTDYVESFLS
jgi:hypothetical protein